MPGEIKSSGEALYDNEVFPEFVYINLPAKFVALAITAPNKKAKMPDDPVINAATNKVSIKLKNNNTYSVMPNRTNRALLERLRGVVSTGVYNLLAPADASKLNKPSRADFEKFLMHLEEQNPMLPSEIEKANQEENTLRLVSPENSLEIEGIFYKGQYYAFEDFDRLKQEIVSEPLAALCPVRERDYLYRAVDEQEWKQIIKDGVYCIRDRTNFEKEIGPQVKEYSQTKGYAGKVVRIKVPGPYFRAGGMAVPRVESMTALFAETEVLEGDKWIAIRNTNE